MSSQIPGYQVIRKVGEGGMSTVYLAIQLSVGREVALKVLSPELRSDPNFAKRFYREANIVGRLSHPNIISIYDVGKHGNHYYMAMDYLPGESCNELIRKQKISVPRALAILRDITCAIDYSHDKGYLHCDIKPDNILFRTNGSAVLTDFGIARELHENNASGTLTGTAHYMSPEQAQGLRLDKTSDIYSLGILLFEMLTGTLPYNARDVIAVAIKHVSAPIPALPAELKLLQPLLDRMLAKKPGARFQNGNELKHAIDFYESQYLKQEAIALPAAARIRLQLQQLHHRIKSALGSGSRLQYSLRHGLILKLTDHDFDIPDIERITRTLDASLQTAKTGSGAARHPLDLALESDQARVLLPAFLLNSLLVLVVLAALALIASGPVIEHINSLGSPDIIYVD